ncbi:MAG: Crp/Fnr family transcriptional regulator [Acidiferrobacteraceae bacterium]
MSTRAVTYTNQLLQTLPLKVAQHLRARCDPVELTWGTVLCEPGEPIRHVYFPHNCMVVLLTPVDHAWAEVGLIGSEGMVGATLALGVTGSTVRMLVQGSGTALRMSTASFRKELKGSAALKRHLDSYLYMRIAQTAQRAACNLFHSVRPRFVRWLLLTQDRMHSDEFDLTQEFLAQMLGMGRASVVHAAGILQKEHLIRYSRGHITILDREGLERAACVCFSMVRDHPANILPFTTLKKRPWAADRCKTQIHRRARRSGTAP